MEISCGRSTGGGLNGWFNIKCFPHTINSFIFCLHTVQGTDLHEHSHPFPSGKWEIHAALDTWRDELSSFCWDWVRKSFFLVWIPPSLGCVEGSGTEPCVFALVPALCSSSTGSFLLIKSCISQLSPGKSAANKDEEIIRLFLPRLCSLGIALLWDPFVFPTQFQALVIYIGFKSILHRWKLYCPKFIQQSRLSLALEWRFLVRKKQLNQLFFGQMCYTHRDSP